MAATITGDPVYTTGVVARYCRVAQRTVCQWVDCGRLVGYRIPSCGTGEPADRRVRRSSLLAFMKRHGLPTDLVPGGEGGGGRVLAVGLSAALARRLADAPSVEGLPLTVVAVAGEFEAGVAFAACPPDVVVVDAGASDSTFAARLRGVVGGEAVPVVATTGEYHDEEFAARWLKAGFARVTADPEEVVRAVVGWRQLATAPPKPRKGRSFNRAAVA